MKTDLGQIAKAYLGSAAFFTIATEGIGAFVARQGGYSFDPVSAALLGFSVPALPFGWYLAGRVAHLTRPPQKMQPVQVAAFARSIPLNHNGKTGNIFSNSVAWVVGQRSAPGQTWGFEDKPGRVIKYKEPKPEPEFIFWEQGMESLITEVRLLNFCRLAWRRQQQVSFGDLASNQIFSREYFTRTCRPRWPKPDYRSIIHILVSRQLIVNRWQGRGGELQYPPGISAEEARRRW